MQIRYINDYGDGTSGYADYGSGVVVTTLSGQPLPVTTQVNATATDAFGRLRTSAPFTLFDSSHRYRDNGLWATTSGTGGTTTFDANAGLVALNTMGYESQKKTSKYSSSAYIVVYRESIAIHREKQM